MTKSDLIEPFFSLGIERRDSKITGHGGYLGLGEIVPAARSRKWARTPVVPLPQIPAAVAGNKTAYWALEVKSVQYGAGCNSTKVVGLGGTQKLDWNFTSFNAILDNGNPLTFLPHKVSEAINAHSLLQLYKLRTVAIWMADCNATVPAFGVGIDNQIFWHDPRDMIYNNGDGTYGSSIASAEDVSLEGVVADFLGMQFFKSVVAQFDFGVNETKFAGRE
jgi:hypothetical protein